MVSHGSAPGSPFGVRLRQWRQLRRLSQLELAGRADSTARHVSFLETGRSRPSREMVLRLTDVLDLPPRERNLMLQAAGLGPAYPQGAVGDPELAPYAAAIDRLLAAHDPFPALVLDTYSVVVAANRACAPLFGEGLVGTNLAEFYLGSPTARDAIVNWPEVAYAALSRLRRQRDRAPLDERLQQLVELAELAVADLPHPDHTGPDSLVVCPWFRVDDTIVRTIVLTARFDAALDVTLDDLRVELMYPLDPETERFLRQHAGA